MSTAHRPIDRLGLIFALMAALGFSFKAIFVKLSYAAAQVDAATLLTLRMSFALPFFIGMTLSSKAETTPMTRSDWVAVIVLGILGYYASSLLDFYGLLYISAGLERLILFTYPTLTLVIGVLFLGKAMNRRDWPALGLTYIGIGLAFWHDIQVTAVSKNTLLGAALVFGSALTYACYNLGAERSIRRIGATRFAGLTLLASTLIMQAHFLTQHSLATLQQPPVIYAYCLAMALFSTVLPVWWQSKAIRLLGAERSAMISTLGPMLTIGFSAVLLNETLSAAQLGGALLVMSGIAWMTFGGSLKKAK